MAIMYPKDLAQYMPTDSERIVYHELKQQLPDTFSVFYSVKWSTYEQGHLVQSEADFVVESPDHGYLCLEVKGGSGIRVDGDTWYLEDNEYGERKLNISPYDQAEKSMYYFRSYFSNRYNTPYSGIFGAAVIFPFYALGDDIKISDREKNTTIDCKDINHLFNRIKKLFRMWSGTSYGRRFYSPSHHNAFLELIRERIAIAAAAGALVRFKENQLGVINRVQDNFVYFLKNVRQFYIRGGAGTGKTWIAMKMAKEESSDGEKRVLFLCQSPHLANYVSTVIGDTVTVLDTNTLFSKVISNFNEFQAPLYQGISQGLKLNIELFDAIFVDEAQDFTVEWATLVRKLLSDSIESRLGVFYDDVQILREDSFGEGFGINSKPFLLRENIRNTANIYRWTAEKTKLGTDVVVNPIEGPTPQTEAIGDSRQLTHYLEVFFYRYLVEEHLSNDSIAVIVDDIDMFMRSFSDGVAKWKFVRSSVKNEDEIRVFSIEEVKGLEADMVLYIHSTDVSENENYIAYTRAKYYLIELIRNYKNVTK